MSRYAKGLCFGLLALLALSVGCSRNEAATPVVAETADQAVLQVARGLGDGHPEMAWHALPESYQQDVTELIHEAAAKMDPEVWNRTFGVVEKATRVLDEKREFILGHPMLASQIKDRAEADAAWDGVVGILQTITDSDLADLDSMRSFDVERFLSETGGDLMEEFEKLEALAPNQGPAEKLFTLADTKATLVSSEGETARVRVEAPGKPATEDDYVRVEGKWIPAELANEWDKTIAEAREQLAGFSGEEMAKNKPAYLMQLSMIDGALDQLLATETAEEFQVAVGGLMGLAMGAMMSQAQSSPSVNVFDMASADEAPSESAPSYPPGLDARPPMPKSLIGAAPPPSGAGGIRGYVGYDVKVTERDGSTTKGRLVELTDDLLMLEKRIGESWMTIELSRAQIDSVDPIRQ